MSKYSEKVKRREQGICKKEGMYKSLLESETTTKQNYSQQEYATPQEIFKSATVKVSTHTSYISQNGNPGIIIRPESHAGEILSMLIIEKKGKSSYGINMRNKNGSKEKPIVNTTFQELYKDSVIVKRRMSQVELRAIEETIEDKRKYIEGHLEITLG